MPKALVTGGAGFIGSHLTEALLSKGWAVRVADDLSTGNLANLERIWGDVEFQQADIRDLDRVRTACRGVEVVFHLAALGSVPRSVADPLTSHQVNVDGTLHVLQAAREAGVRRVVYSASSSAYGNTPSLPKEEGMTANPLSPYAVTKFTGELYAKVFAGVYGLETVSLRYFNIFGPRQSPDSQYAAVIPRFISAMLKGERPTIYGDGFTSRDFTYVTNAVHANVLAAEAPRLQGEVINIACGERYTLNALVHQLNTALGTDLAPVYAPERPGDVKHSLAAIDRARTLLGYEPLVGFGAGLQRTVGWFREKTAQEVRP